MKRKKIMTDRLENFKEREIEFRGDLIYASDKLEDQSCKYSFKYDEIIDILERILSYSYEMRNLRKEIV